MRAIFYSEHYLYKFFGLFNLYNRVVVGWRDSDIAFEQSPVSLVCGRKALPKHSSKFLRLTGMNV